MSCESERAVDADLTIWKRALKRPAIEDGERHVIHSYFNACPESPDGKHVLFFASTKPEGEFGDVCLVERGAGRETVLARGVTTEDAHRVACQQWVNGGRQVVYHDCRNGKWVVVAVDVAAGKSRVLAEDRQLGFGSQTEPWVPVYGCHWNPGGHRDLELIHVETGEIRIPVKIGSVVEKFGPWIDETFGSVDVSVFFPVLSPDGKKAFFKIAQPGGGEDFRSPQASKREGKIVCDLESGELIRLFPSWGHPSWHPDSRRIFEYGNVLADPVSDEIFRPAPSSLSNHPSVSPDGHHFITDANVSHRPFGRPGYWAIVIGSMKSDTSEILHMFDNSKGPASWRRNHPHPVFSADGRRIYYNVNDERWTRLMVIEAGEDAFL